MHRAWRYPFLLVEDIFDMPAPDKEYAAFIESCKTRHNEIIASASSDSEEFQEPGDGVTILSGLLQACRKEGLDGHSVEFRQRLTALASDEDMVVTKEQLCAEIMGQIATIQGYHDNALLNRFMENTKNFHTDSHEFLALLTDAITPLETIKKMLQANPGFEKESYKCCSYASTVC